MSGTAAGACAPTTPAPASSHRTNSSRTKARRRAVEVLFEADQRSLSPRELADQRFGAADGSTPSLAYACTMLHGTTDHLDEIDEWLASFSQGWRPNRMPAVDKAILRAGVWEIVWADDVPDEVTMKDMTDLAASLSTDESPRFINGLLGAISRLKASLI